LLGAGQLRVTDEAFGSVLATSDIGFRFNNWDRVRAQRIPILLGYAAVCGVTATLFLVLVTGRLAYRGEKEAVAV
jgi:predicted xylose isomerase-like sugar epimerase